MQLERVSSFFHYLELVHFTILFITEKGLRYIIAVLGKQAIVNLTKILAKIVESHIKDSIIVGL